MVSGPFVSHLPPSYSPMVRDFDISDKGHVLGKPRTYKDEVIENTYYCKNCGIIITLLDGVHNVLTTIDSPVATKTCDELVMQKALK